MKRKYIYKPTKELAASVIDMIKSKCVECEECGEQWCWTGNHSDNMPQATVEKDWQRLSVRKAVYTALRGQLMPGRVLVTNCDNQRCLNPELLAQITRAKLLGRLSDTGRINNVAHKIAKTVARRSRGTKLSMELAEEIRRNPDISAKDYAQRLGVFPQSISAIRHYKIYKPTSAFTGLMK